MKTATLDRFCYADFGTFGKIITPAGRRLATVERPWLNNVVGISCIPEGAYTCVPSRYHRGGYDAIEIKDVAGRTLIKIHIANLPEEVEGCIGVGVRHGAIGGRWAAISSKKAFKSLMNELGADNFKLIITSSSGGKGKI
jgi:hypothetical protein